MMIKIWEDESKIIIEKYLSERYEIRGKENRIWIEEEQDGEHTFNAEVTMP